jgi:hypothetical protein
MEDVLLTSSAGVTAGSSRGYSFSILILPLIRKAGKVADKRGTNGREYNI